MKSLIILLILPAVLAVANYRQCLECFYGNRTGAYFCQSNNNCLPLRSTSCPSNQIVLKDYQCVNGFQLCTNVTFLESSVGTNQQFGYGLPAGQGCYIQIDRLRNGSYGSMSLRYDDPSILVFDNTERNYQPGTVLGLPLTDYGWGPRKVFIVNKGDSPAGFTVEFIGGIISTVSYAVLALTLLLAHY